MSGCCFTIYKLSECGLVIWPGRLFEIFPNTILWSFGLDMLKRQAPYPIAPWIEVLGTETASPLSYSPLYEGAEPYGILWRSVWIVALSDLFAGMSWRSRIGGSTCWRSREMLRRFAYGFLSMPKHLNADFGVTHAGGAGSLADNLAKWLRIYIKKI